MVSGGLMNVLVLIVVVFFVVVVLFVVVYGMGLLFIGVSVGV